jgi:hypothetical protein
MLKAKELLSQNNRHKFLFNSKFLSIVKNLSFFYYRLGYMYIGPWQEYKLASVIKIKNELFDGSVVASPKLTEQTLLTHDRTLTTDSTSTDRTFASENVQRRYPRFNIDTFYKQWKRVEDVLAKSEAPYQPPKKPNIPTVERKRHPKSLQAQRISKMRDLYGINEKPGIKLPKLGKITESPQGKQEKQKERLVLPPINQRKHEEVEDEHIEGLLQWVKELPEEVSVGSSEMSHRALKFQ